MQAYLNWKRNGTLISGFDGSKWIDKGITMPVSFPGTTTPIQIITLTTSSRDLNTYESFNNIQLYLSGDPNQIEIVQSIWPYYGADTADLNGVHPRPELDGGFKISFDGGQTFILFDQEHGYEADPSTWIQLPQSAIGLSAVNGVLGAYDMASMMVMCCIPLQADQLQIINVRLAASFDIV